MAEAIDRALDALEEDTKTRRWGGLEVDKQVLEDSLEDHTYAIYMLEGRDGGPGWGDRLDHIRKRIATLQKLAADMPQEGEDSSQDDFRQYDDLHLHARAMARGGILQSLTEKKLEDMLVLTQREQVGNRTREGGIASVEWPEKPNSVSDLPGFSSLPFLGLEDFKSRLDGDDYDYPEVGKGEANLKTVRVISSGGELRKNADYMGNCTSGYARAISSGRTRIVAVNDENGNCVLNLSFISGGRNAGCPVKYRGLVSQMLQRLNEGGGNWALGEINTRFNQLSDDAYYVDEGWEVGEDDLHPDPILPIEDDPAEEAAWSIQERLEMG